MFGFKSPEEIKVSDDAEIEAFINQVTSLSKTYLGR